MHADQVDPAASPTGAGRVEIVAIEATETHRLRREVLRDGDAAADVDAVEDHGDGAFHLGARDAVTGELVGVASFSPAETPWRPGAPAFQLRWMAVDERARGAGAGRALLDVAVGRLRAVGVAVLWARGLDTALGFYERWGMTVVGEPFFNDAGLSHHMVVCDLVDPP